MGTGAVLLVKLPEHPCNTEINRWRRDLLNAFDPDEYNFYSVGPLRIIRPNDPSDVKVPPGPGVWLDAEIWTKFSRSGSYRRGDGQDISMMAEWFETHIPNCKVWYGHDASDDSLRPFGLE